MPELKAAGNEDACQKHFLHLIKVYSLSLRASRCAFCKTSSRRINVKKKCTCLSLLKVRLRNGKKEEERRKNWRQGEREGLSEFIAGLPHQWYPMAIPHFPRCLPDWRNWAVFAKPWAFFNMESPAWLSLHQPIMTWSTARTPSLCNNFENLSPHGSLKFCRLKLFIGTVPKLLALLVLFVYLSAYFLQPLYSGRVRRSQHPSFLPHRVSLAP